MTEEQALKIATHRHYKGGLYRLMYENVINTETSELMVIYQHVWPHEPKIYARPQSNFYSRTQEGDGVWRFTLLPNLSKDHA